jgi:TetR/AcrR family transcriptional regulator, cholesterol catabolism regulator
LEEVLTCAAAMFSSRGYAATTLEDIGAELGMTRPGLYYYTKSKEDLLDQCYAWGYKKLMDRLDGELGDGTGRELLVRFFQIYSEVVCDDSSRCFLASENHFLSPKRQKIAAERVHKINDLVGNLIERGMTDGSLAPCDGKFALIVLFGAFNALPKLYKRRGPSPVEMGKDLLDIILSGMMPRQ